MGLQAGGHPIPVLLRSSSRQDEITSTTVSSSRNGQRAGSLDLSNPFNQRKLSASGNHSDSASADGEPNATEDVGVSHSLDAGRIGLGIFPEGAVLPQYKGYIKASPRTKNRPTPGPLPQYAQLLPPARIVAHHHRNPLRRGNLMMSPITTDSTSVHGNTDAVVLGAEHEEGGNLLNAPRLSSTPLVQRESSSRASQLYAPKLTSIARFADDSLYS